MTSQINPNNIDGTYPVAGQANNTQGFRDNFTNIKTNFSYAEQEIDDLQSKAVLKSALTGETLDNNMNNNLIYNVKLNDVCYTYLQNTATSGTITLDYEASQFQYVSTTGSVSLAFSNWCPSGSAGTLQFTINITNVAHTLTLPASVIYGLYGIQGINPGTAGVSNTITFGTTGQYTFRFGSANGGATFDIFDFSRAYNQFAGNVYINGTSNSTSPTTGALQVDGGVGIVGNLNTGGNLAVYAAGGDPVFQVTTSGFVQIDAPSIPANTNGALNVVGSSDGAYQAIRNPGSMIHITGNDNLAGRFTVDAFGSAANAYPILTSRRARGTAASPSAVQAGDVLARVTASGWGTSDYVLGAANVAPTSIDFFALENFATGNSGSSINFYTAPVGGITKTLSANITANLTTFPSVVSVTGNVITANVNTGNISLTGNVVSALPVTGNITGGNIISVAAINGATISTSGNIISGGNILANDGGAVGYTNGAGGTVSQTGNKSTGVTLNKITGEITMQGTALGASTAVSFTLTNSTIGARDLLLINLVGGGTPGSYTYGANCTTGSAVITVRNVSLGSLSESLVLRYAVIRGSIA